MDYKLRDPNYPKFDVGGTSNPNKKRKENIPKASGPTFTTFEGVLLVKPRFPTTWTLYVAQGKTKTSIGRRFEKIIMNIRNM